MAKMNVTEKDFEAFLQATESIMAMSGTLDEGFDEEAYAINRQFKSFKRRYLIAKEEEMSKEKAIIHINNVSKILGTKRIKISEGTAKHLQNELCLAKKELED